MRKTDTNAFVTQLLVYTLVMIGFTGSVGLGAVWLRHQISVTANQTRQLDARIADVERRLAETDAAIETERGPNVLTKRDAEWRLGLLPPQEPQVVRVAEDVDGRLAAKRNQGLIADGIRVVVNQPGGVAVR